jgi:hypothetical protein
LALLELVLDSGDRQEIRLTDQPLAVGDVLDLHGTYWEVVRVLSRAERSRARLQCRRAREIGRSDQDIRRRAAETRRRLELLRARVWHE